MIAESRAGQGAEGDPDQVFSPGDVLDMTILDILGFGELMIGP